MFNYKQKTCEKCPFFADKELRYNIDMHSSIKNIDFCILSAVLYDGMFEGVSKDKKCSCNKLRKEILRRVRKDIIKRIRKSAI